MDEWVPADLIHLSDGRGVSLVLRAVEHHEAGRARVRAECLITTDFVSARLETYIPLDDLEEWEEALRRLSAGEDAGWPQGTPTASPEAVNCRPAHELRALSIRPIVILPCVPAGP
ncbi:DUF5959 family protein [Streptomyces coeruleorubidus]|uniref:DUF5959 family protein n=1 Tax=Streptomyces coeruleorubidus TaxID=116188 RepID=UPI0033AF7AC0